MEQISRQEIKVFCNNPELLMNNDLIEKNGYSLVLDNNNPEVLIIDLAFCQGTNELVSFQYLYGVPALIIIKNSFEAEPILGLMQEYDDLCWAQSYKEEVLLRIHLLYKAGISYAHKKNIANTDALTGLYNRRYSDKLLSKWIHGVGTIHPKLSVILFDIDHFKRINDVYGHNFADGVLKDFGRILNQHSSIDVVASRVGGEEFLITMKCDNQQAYNFAEFLRNEIENNTFEANCEITASFGIATIHDKIEPNDLFKLADVNLYQAKAEGRNRVVGLIAESDSSDTSFNQNAIIKDFEHRVQIMTERLSDYVKFRGRSLADHYQQEADVDGMTGLYRKEYFNRRLARDFENSRKEQRALTLLFLDIDHFGQVNKTYGYPTGDQALKIVSGILLESVRTVDWGARYGGEELCIIMPITPLEQAIIVAERIRKQIEDTVITSYDGRQFQLTASIGLAELQESDIEPVDFIQRASDKTREAKESGRNNIKS